MNPNPFAVLKNFTVPFMSRFPAFVMRCPTLRFERGQRPLDVEGSATDAPDGTISLRSGTRRRSISRVAPTQETPIPNGPRIRKGNPAAHMRPWLVKASRRSLLEIYTPQD